MKRTLLILLLSAATVLGQATKIREGSQTTGALPTSQGGTGTTNGTVGTLTNVRTIWGQSFDGSGNVTGAMTSVTSVTGSGGNMTISPTGNSSTLTLYSDNSGGTALAFLTGNADQSSTFGGNISGTGAWTLTGGAGNMTITAGTGNSRTMTFKTTTSGGTATTAATIGATQVMDFANVPTVGGVAIPTTSSAVVGLFTSCSGTQYLGADGACHTASGTGTVTNTGGNLTSNAIVLGAGTVDTKVSTGIITDGASKLTLGLNTSTLGQIKLFGNTSGDATIQPAAIAGTATVVTLPNASSTLPIFGQQITFSGPTAARTVTLPDASITVARTDAANTFTGHQTIEGVTSTGATGTGKFVFNAAPSFANASTSAPSFNIGTGGSLETTSAAGDVEADANCFYGTTDAGNRGYIGLIAFIRADSTVTYANDTNAHAIFTTPTNGRLTLETGTYRFHGTLAFTSMSGTSGNLKVDMLGAGTATITHWIWTGLGGDTSAGTTVGTNCSWMNTNVSGANIVGAQTGTQLGVQVDGTFKVTGAGTIIPTMTQNTAAAAVLSVGSYLEVWRIGSTTVTTVGQWD